jgi:hypothetical protein
MSHEGVTLVAWTVLVISLIIIATIHLVGPSRGRGRIMLAGTLGGISVGVLLAYPISHWLRADVSFMSACFGMALGCGVGWLFARQIPRDAN